jgi:hypothetical protein
MEGQVFGEDERGGVRPVLEQAPLLPQEAIEVGRVVGAQAAPEDEEVGARDCTRWIELKAAEVADGLEDAVRAIAGETLARDRQPARGP